MKAAAVAYFATLEKRAAHSFGRTVATGAAVGGGIGGLYQGGRAVVRELKKKPGTRHLGLALADGFMEGLPRGAAIGGLVAGGNRLAHGVDQAVAHGAEAAKRTGAAAAEVGEAVKRMSESVNSAEGHLRATREGLVDPAAQALKRLRSEQKGPTLMGTFVRSKLHRLFRGPS